MRERRLFYIAFILLVLLTALPVWTAAQSIVTTLDFRPPGVQNQVGLDYRIAVVESTGLVYIGTAPGYGEEVGVINPTKNTLMATIPVPTGGSNFTLVRPNQATKLVYLRVANMIAVVDGRPASPTFHKALSPLTFSDVVQSFAIDESSGLMYVTVQSRVSIVDVNPGSGTFHQVLREVLLPQNALAQGVAVNPVTHKAYVGVTGGGVDGVHVFDGTNLNLIPGTVGAFGVIVNENANLIYATANGNRLNAIDGATDSLLALIDMPGTINSVNFDMRMAVNRVTGRVYVRSNESPAPDKLMVVDGKRSSSTFNTVLAAIEVGRWGYSVAVDESLNRVITNSFWDLRTFIVDGSTNTVMRVIPSMQTPSDVALNRVTHRAYVANQLNSVQVIDVANNRLMATVTTATELGGAVINPANHLLYFALTTGTSGMRTVDKNGNLGTVTGFPTTAGRYLFTAINRNTNRIYVQNSGANVSGDAEVPGFVSVVSGKKVIANVTSGNQPFGLAVNETTNKIYSVDAGLGAVLPHSITVIDGATNATLQADVSAFPAARQFCCGVTGVNETTNKIYFTDGPYLAVLDGLTNVAKRLPSSLVPVANFIVSKTLNRIYVASRDANLLHVLDGASDTEIATLSMDSPGALAVNETTGRIYVANEATKSVTVMDGATNAILATIVVGALPAALAVNEIANRIYVYNSGDSSVAFINGATNSVEATLALPSLPVTIVADPAVARVYALENNGNGQLFILSDTAGTLTALRQSIVSATTGNPIVRLSMLVKFGVAELALARGNTRAGVIALQSLEDQVQSQRGKTLTNAEADNIKVLIDAVIASVS
jgi:YVTN family beta-propeller protein